jgi:hypothetical protein
MHGRRIALFEGPNKKASFPSLPHDGDSVRLLNVAVIMVLYEYMKYSYTKGVAWCGGTLCRRAGRQSQMGDKSGGKMNIRNKKF